MRKNFNPAMRLLAAMALSWFTCTDPAAARVITLAGDGECAPQWVSTFGGQPGVTGIVRAMTSFDDGSGGGDALYVGGHFTIAGGVSANRIAKWDGASWSRLGTGMNQAVRALAVFDDGSGGGPALYAAGQFYTASGVSASRVAKWDGNSWSPLGSGVNGTAHALAVFDDGSGGGPALYVGGTFTTAGGVSANGIAKWDGGAWSPLESGLDNTVYALTVFDDGSGDGPALYAGGSFTHSGSFQLNRMAKWDGSSWTRLGIGMNNVVNALTVFDDQSGNGPALYAAGNFTSAGGVFANRIAKWDGVAWSTLGSGNGLNNNAVSALTVFDDGSGNDPALYAGGSFVTADGISTPHVAKWDGDAWSPLSNGVNGTVYALTVFDDSSTGGDALYVGGNLTFADNAPAFRIARWGGTSWSPLDQGMNTEVRVMTLFDDGSKGGPALYVGGQFTTAGGVSAVRIGKWDGVSWTTLGSGMNGGVNALAACDDGNGGGPVLYAGGVFTNAGGVSAIRIAKWNGTSWSPLGSGMHNEVLALAIFDDGSGSGPALYAGGLFLAAGGVPVNHIAKWDGTSWSPLGSGMNNEVRALTVFDDGSGPALYAGGTFTSAGGVAANRVARWDGTSWAPVGGTATEIRVLTVLDDGSGPALYAGGIVGTAGSVEKWNGTFWSSVGFGMNDEVRSLAAFDDGSGGGPALYAGGLFTAAGGVPANRIAKRTGTSWSPLGTGMNDAVLALQAFDDGSGRGPALHAGGKFTISPAGDSFLARWQGCPVPPGIPGDFNGDGIVDLADLLILLESWGPCPPAPASCAADLNDDGAVDFADLLIVFDNWG